MPSFSTAAQSAASSSSQEDMRCAYRELRDLSDMYVDKLRATIAGAPFTLEDFRPLCIDLEKARKHFDAVMAPHIGYRTIAPSA